MPVVVRTFDSLFGGVAFVYFAWIYFVANCASRVEGGYTCETDFTTLPRSAAGLLAVAFVGGAVLQNVFATSREHSWFADMGGTVLSTIGGMWSALLAAACAVMIWQGGSASLDHTTIWPAAAFGGIFGFLFWNNRPRAHKGA